MLRFALLVCLGALTLAAGPASAQDAYPVSIGVGGGRSGIDTYHGLATVTLKPTTAPVSLRLDGMMGRVFGGRPYTRNTTTLSASAVITLRPWRVEPYLIVGASRTSAFVLEVRDTHEMFYSPSRTELTGGLGLGWKLGRATLFGEFRKMGVAGSPLTIGLSF